MPEVIYTTGKVAKLLRVAPRTVSKWIDNGQLKGFRIPGAGTQNRESGDRRVAHSELLAFMQRNNYPLTILLGLDGDSSNAVDNTRHMADAVDNVKKFVSSASCDLQKLQSDMSMVVTAYETMALQFAKES